jgi:hypothetical protein
VNAAAQLGVERSTPPPRNADGQHDIRRAAASFNAEETLASLGLSRVNTATMSIVEYSKRNPVRPARA